MTRPTISTVPVPPSRLAGAAAFSPGMAAFMSGVQAFATEADALGAWAETQMSTKYAFFSYLSANWSATGAVLEAGLPGVGGTQIPFDLVTLNTGGGYSGGVFTAPAAGLYWFGFRAQIKHPTGAAVDAKFGLYHVTGSAYLAKSASISVDGRNSIGVNAVAQLAAGGQVRVDAIAINPSNGYVEQYASFCGRRLA